MPPPCGEANSTQPDNNEIPYRTNHKPVGDSLHQGETGKGEPSMTNIPSVGIDVSTILVIIFH